MDLSFENTVALVFGSGLATARAFAEVGGAVAMADIDEHAACIAAESLAVAGHKALAIRCNVADEAEVAAMVDRTVAAFGGLDAAFNNVDMHAPSGETADAEAEDFDHVIAINLRGIWACMKHELRHMRTRGSGAIVNCSSQSSLIGTAGLGAYTASKHGIVGLTKAAALEYAPRGIRINTVCPSTTNTSMVVKALPDHPKSMHAVKRAIALGRPGLREEIASTAFWGKVRHVTPATAGSPRR